MVDEEGSLEARHSLWWEGGGVATVGALNHMSLWGLACHRLKALLTEDMEAVEKFGVRELVQTYRASQLLTQFLQSLFGRRGRLSHYTMQPTYVAA